MPSAMWLKSGHLGWLWTDHVAAKLANAQYTEFISESLLLCTDIEQLVAYSSSCAYSLNILMNYALSCMYTSWQMHSCTFTTPVTKCGMMAVAIQSDSMTSKS